MTRVVVDPVTRIEGHLRIEAVVENGVITDAFSAGTMVRGLEKILIGRDPRDAWAITERVCGVCTTVHALTSVRAVERRAGHRRSAHRRAHPQHHDDHPVRAGSRDPLLSPARARLGGHRQRAEGRSEEGRGAGRPLSPSGTRTRLPTSPRCRTRSRPSPPAAWASSPTATGATRPTSCRPR